MFLQIRDNVLSIYYYCSIQQFEYNNKRLVISQASDEYDTKIWETITIHDTCRLFVEDLDNPFYVVSGLPSALQVRHVEFSGEYIIKCPRRMLWLIIYDRIRATREDHGSFYPFMSLTAEIREPRALSIPRAN